MLGAVIWIGPAAFATFSEVARRRLHGEPPASAQELLFYGGDWLVYALIAPVIFWIARKWPVIRPHLLQRSILHFAFAVLFCFVWAIVGKLLQLALAAIIQPSQLRERVNTLGDQLTQNVVVNVAEWILITLPFGVIVYVTVAGLAHAIRYFDEARDREVMNARLSEQLTAARFSTLQAQLNPHFLFNALNTLAVRARDGDGAGTAVLVEQLSDVLRRTLTRHRASEVKLREELELVRQYLAIEQSRFSDRLRPTISADNALLAAAVPGFAVQHLVENAIRHGIARRSGAGELIVNAKRVKNDLVVTVADDGPGIAADAPPQPGHGIASTRERLKMLYGDDASLTTERIAPTGTIATLRFPYREIVQGEEPVDE